jgi:pentatricopeptide repeat protein
MDFRNDMISIGLNLQCCSLHHLYTGLCKNGEIKWAIDLLDEIISKGINSDIMNYNTLIDGLCKNDETKKAMVILNDMISIGLEPDAETVRPVTCSTLIWAVQ